MCTLTFTLAVNVDVCVAEIHENSSDIFQKTSEMVPQERSESDLGRESVEWGARL